MGGGGINVPGPTQEERDLQREQVEILRDQRTLLSEQLRQQNLLAPLLFDSAGIKPIFDTEGDDPTRIVGFEQIEDELDPLRDDIEKGFLERTRSAQLGELPVNPALLSDLDEAEETLRNSLRASLGPDFETSTPGSRRLDDFFETKEGILEESRRGDLSLSEGLSLSREASSDARIQSFLNRTVGVNQFQGSTLPGLSNLVQGFQLPISTRQNDRALQLRASIASGQGRSSGFSSLFSGLGSLGGAFIGSDTFAGLFSSGAAGAGATASDRRLKTNITRVGKTDSGLPIYTFQFKSGGPTQMGVMAQDVEKVIPNAVIEIDGIKHVDYTQVN